MNAITPCQDADNGVCQHSSAMSLESYIMFATDKSNRVRFLHWAMTNAVGYKAVRSKYDGKVSTGYIVNATHFDALWNGSILTRLPSMLVLGPLEGQTRASQARPVTLCPLRGGLPRSLGYMVAVEKREAIDAGQWTYDISADTYYSFEHAYSLAQAD